MANLAKYFNKIRIPTAADRVYKDECAFSFANPESEAGLFVDMNTFVAFGKDFVQLNFEKTGDPVYLNIKRTKTLKPQEVKPEGEPPAKKPTVLGIGIEGGFEIDDSRKYDVHDAYSIVTLPDFTAVPYPNPDLPEKVSMSAAAIIKADSAEKQDQVEAWTPDQDIKPSKHADSLVQLDNGVKIPRKGWKCAKCDLTENLWLNLSDGFIGCGRKNWDGTGGNNHASEHFDETGFPLAVKLGTITPDSKADVFSYAEKNEVTNPHLKKHLAHFGINVTEMEKTDKSMAELDLERNLNYDWNRVAEKGKKLEPVFGPGNTGLRNLGNSCYMASVMQVLFSVPQFQQRYAQRFPEIIRSAPRDPTQDLQVQLAKLGNGLLSGQHAVPIKKPGYDEPECEGIAPRSFKSLIGRGHPEFSTNRQQDALEFFQHLVQQVERMEHGASAGKADPTRTFRFKTEERIQCASSGQVKYVYRVDNVLSLPIPLDQATNKEEYDVFQIQVKEMEAKGQKRDPRDPGVRPRVPFQACLNAWAAAEQINDFYSTAIRGRTIAIKTTKLASFPEILVIQMRKFYLDGWTPKKLDVLLDVPDEIDLYNYRGSGKKPDERELPAEPAGGAAPAAPARPAPNAEIVAQIIEMGFPRNRAEKAAVLTNNESSEAAMNWLFAHMEDADIDAPLAAAAPAAPKADAAAKPVNEEAIAMLASMGFSRDQSIKALRATDNNVERAADWIFSHIEELSAASPMEVETPAGQPAAAQPSAAESADVSDGPGRYKLFAFITHVGTSTMSGHYVCHILKDGRWINYDDQKVAVSQDTPRDLGYIYFFRRIRSL
jgi:ubiquitin carboxyl-terminal hydrolase 5/13